MITAQSLGPSAPTIENKTLPQDWVKFQQEDSQEHAIYEIPQTSGKTVPKTWETFGDTDGVSKKDGPGRYDPEEPYEMPYHYPTSPYIPTNSAPTYSTPE